MDPVNCTLPTNIPDRRFEVFTQKMEAAWTSEMSVYYNTTGHNNLKEFNLNILIMFKYTKN
jgi:hypothetical protein